MRVSDLAPNPKNPRTISDSKLAMLKKAVVKFGDLSGIVFNEKSGQLVCGHQRVKLAREDLEVVITKRFDKKTKTGTKAEGYLFIEGEKFRYRAVEWDRATEKAANIAANKGAGEWDELQLGDWLKELQNLDFDLDLTLFDSKELAALPDPIEVAAHTRERKPKADQAPRCRDGQFYMLGGIRLRCGGDLLFCDDILSKWERHSGEVPRLIEKVGEPEKQVKKQVTRSPSARA